MADDEERRGRGGVGDSGSRGGVGSVFGGGVEFAELFEKTECALEGAFGGGFVAKQEVVLLNIVGGPIGGRETFGGAFMAI